MNSFQNSISRSRLVALMAMAVAGMAAFLGFVAYGSLYDEANGFETRIVALHRNNENILSQYTQKMLEASQVPAMMRDDLKDVAKATMQGRFGPDGARAMVSMLNEQNAQVSQELYAKLQQLVEAGRDELKNNQTMLIDTKRSYEYLLGRFVIHSILAYQGFPRINLDSYSIISTESAAEAARTGRESAPIQLRGVK